MSDEPAKPGPVVLRIKLRYEDVDTMVHRFAPNVGKSGLFIPTRSLQAIGAEIKFELRLANDMPVLVGHGRVKHVREPDPKNPKASFGMAVELLRVTRESREVILRMLERRKTLGLAEVAIPMPEDLETPPAKESGPVLTAPRRQSGSIPVANLATAATLPPEPARKKRPVIGDLIASASGPVSLAAIPELDESVDVGAAISRARVLAAGTDLDAELEAIRDSAAAPIEISIEAASAELARQLGGIAVRRGWAAPPQIAEAPKPEPAPPPEPVVASPTVAEEPIVARTRTPVIEGEKLDELLAEDEPKPEPEQLEARSRERRLHLRSSRTRSRDLQRPAPIVVEPEPAPEEISISEAEVVGETVLANMPSADHAPEEADVLQTPRLFVPTGVEDITTDPGAEVLPTGPLIDDDSDPEEFVRAAPHHSGEHELLDEADLEEVEHTQTGDLPVDPDAFAAHAYATEPAVHDDPEQAAIAESLDAQLAEAEAEELPELEAEELDDLDILAEADADDADLLLADGEADSSEPLPSNDIEPARPSEMDFVARLDFGGEATPPPQHFDPLSGFDRDSMADFGAPAHHMGDDDDFGEPYTRRSDPSAFVEPIEPLPTFEIAHSHYDIPAIEEDDFHERRAANPPQISVRTNVLNPDETYNEPPQEPQYLQQAPDDLDDALEALDVEVDDLSIPHARRPSTGVSRVAKRAGTAAPKPKRAPSEDGILIDFGDDDE